MSDNSEMVDAKETPLAAVIDDSCTLQYIEITPRDRPSDDCYRQECIDPVVEVKPEDLQDVNQEPADETDNEAYIPQSADVNIQSSLGMFYISFASIVIFMF